MEFHAVCTWGDGPDVLLKIDNQTFDLTASQAKDLANQLLMAAKSADDIEALAKSKDELCT